MYSLFSKIFLLLLILWGNSAWADLMIAPTRVVFEDRERAATVNLINVSNKTNTYRLHWSEKKQKPDGQYKNFASNEKSTFAASKMLRFSPRQVTLAPGQRQTVRLMLRRKKGLKVQDYRSHLVFQKLPDQDELNEDDTRGAKLRLKVNLGFSIPVIVRQGTFNSSLKIAGIEMLEAEENGKKVYGVGVNMLRSGMNSIYGSVNVYWKKHQGKSYKKVGTLNNVAIYPELDSRAVNVGLKDISSKSGIIKVVYEGDGDLKNRITETYERKINSKEYKPYKF